MKYSLYLKEGLNSWPSSISIQDGELREDDGAWFPTLSQIWDEIEQQQERISNIHGLICWALFSGIHKLARTNLESEAKTVDVKLIDLDYVHSKFNESFFDAANDWSEYHSQWDDDYRTKFA